MGDIAQGAKDEEYRISNLNYYDEIQNPLNKLITSTNSLVIGNDITSTKGFTTDQLKEIAKTYQKVKDAPFHTSRVNEIREKIKQGKYYDSANGRYLGYFSYYGYDYLDKGAGTKEQSIFELSDSKFPIGKTQNSKYVDLIESISSLASPEFTLGADNPALERIQLSPKLLTKVKINSLFKDKLHLRGYNGEVNEHQGQLENTNELLTVGLFKDTVDYSQILPNLDTQSMNIDATKYNKMKLYYDNVDWDGNQVIETSSLNSFKQKLKANIDIYEKIEQIKASQDEQEKTRLKEEVRALLQSPDNLFNDKFNYVINKEKFISEIEKLNTKYNKNYDFDYGMINEQLDKGLSENILGREIEKGRYQKAQDDLARYKEEARKYITENIPEELGRDELLEKLNRDELQESDFEALRTQIKERIVDKGDKHIVMGWNTTVDGDKLTAIGDHNQLKGEKQVVIGNDNVLEQGATNTFVLGSNVHANVSNSVALGNETSLEEAVATPSHSIAGTVHNFAGNAPVGTVSIGADGKERTLTHLAAGRISDTSTDGINGSQLNAVIGEINKVAESLSRFSIVGGKNISVKKEGDTYTITSAVTSSANAGTTAEAVAKPTIVGDKNIETEVAENGHVTLKLKDDLDVKTVHANTIHSERVNTTQLNATEVNTKNMNAEKMTVEKLIVGGNELGTKGLMVGDININENGIDAGNKPINNVANGEISPNSKQAINGSQIFPIVNQLYQQGGQIQQLDGRINNVEQRLIKQNKRLEARIAGVAALNGVPQATTPGKNMVGVGAASSGSGHAIAIGYSVLSDNSKHVVKTSFTIDSQKRAIGNIGYGFQW